MTERKEGFVPPEKAEVNTEVEKIITQITTAAPRIKELGNWPGWVEEESLAERVPKQGDTNAPGFDCERKTKVGRYTTCGVYP